MSTPSSEPFPKYEGTTAESNLLKPIKVGNLELQNRIVLAPLTRLRSAKHVPHELAVEYYKQRAQAPGTLLITEATFIAPQAGGFPYAPGIWSDEQGAVWKRVFEAIHSQKSYVYTQLWALGRNGPADGFVKDNIRVVSASNIAIEGRDPPHPLTVDEIKTYVSWYVAAAQRAIEAGSDGVEIHSANGYLLDQFLRENVNNRTDQYGGSIENRARFLFEVIDAVVAKIGADKVGVRFSPWGTSGGVKYGPGTISQYSYVVSEIEKRGRAGNRLAYIHITEPTVAGSLDIERPPEMGDVNLFFHQIWTGPIIRAGNLVPHLHDAGNYDDRTLVAVGRYFISNPDFVERVRKDEPLVKYDRSTFYCNEEFPAADGYTDYPKPGQETVKL